MNIVAPEANHMLIIHDVLIKQQGVSKPCYVQGLSDEGRHLVEGFEYGTLHPGPLRVLFGEDVDRFDEKCLEDGLIVLLL